MALARDLETLVYGAQNLGCGVSTLLNEIHIGGASG